MTIQQWIAAVVSVLVMLGGTAVNLFIIGRFVGQWNEAMRHLGLTLDDHKDRLGTVETCVDELPLIKQRLNTAEVAVGQFWELRDSFNALKITMTMQGQTTHEKLEGLGRATSVIERQLATLVARNFNFATGVPSSEEKDHERPRLQPRQDPG